MIARIDHAALAEFPELAHLIALRARVGWIFRPTVRDGELTMIQAVRVRPGAWADALAVRYVNEAQAVRCNPAGELVWKYEGSLVAVVDALLELPKPDQAGAPSLAIGRAPRLWRPRR